MPHCDRKLTIVNKLGLHARASASFVKVANRFQSEISVVKGKTRVNGKSIMGLLMLAAGQGTSIKLEIDGEDAEEAINSLAELVEKGFDEK